MLRYQHLRYKALAVARCARAEGGACRRRLQGLWKAHGQAPSPTMATIAYMSPLRPSSRGMWNKQIHYSPRPGSVKAKISASKLHAELT